MKGKYFLGSVGTAEAFRMVTDANGTQRPVLAFRSKTLTDSGLNISTTKDDIRAGTGAPIQFSFYHDPNIEITLTDVLFDEAYVAAQLGSEFKVGGIAYKSEIKSLEGGKITLDNDPEDMPIGCGDSAKYLWYTESGKEDWKVIVIESKEVTNADFKEGVEYCLRYLYHNDAAHVAEITSNMIPQELRLVITAPIYAGDACSASNGKAAGTITFEIPRFKLAGTQDFAFNMSSNATMSLSGNVLANESGCDITGSNLMRIIAVYDNQTWYEGIIELVADEEKLTVGQKPEIFGISGNGSVSRLDNANLDFKQEGSTDGVLGPDGAWAKAGETTISIKGLANSISTTATVKAA